MLKWRNKISIHEVDKLEWLTRKKLSYGVVNCQIVQQRKYHNLIKIIFRLGFPFKDYTIILR